MIFLSFFSINLFENESKKGRVDIKVNQNNVLSHIILSNVSRQTKYDIKFFMGQQGEIGIQKGYLITDNNGNFNNTIRFEKEKSEFNINSFDKISLILLTSKNCANITGFRNEKYDYKKISENKTSIENEYKKNKDYDNIIDNLPECSPFSNKMNKTKFVKIDEQTFKSLNFPLIKQNLKDYAINSLKINGFLILGKCNRGEKNLYILGIPDKYNDSQFISMANMGARKFCPTNSSKILQNGDFGFWFIFL